MIEGLMHVRCARCNRHVDEVVHHVSPVTWDHEFTVRCHGEVDHCVIDRAALEDGAIRLVGEAVAFAPRVLADLS